MKYLAANEQKEKKMSVESYRVNTSERILWKLE